MTSTADQAISALRTGHDTLTGLVAELPDGALTGPSGASEWTIADVLSHLGSGAEIGLATLEASLSGADAPGNDFNQGVWGRWNAMAPQEQADGFVKANEALVSRYEGLDEQTRQTQQIKMFLPDPVDVATSAAFRLNEFTLHSWDVRVAADPAAVLAAEAVPSLLDVAPYMFGWIGKPKDVLAGKHVVVAVHTTDPAGTSGWRSPTRLRWSIPRRSRTPHWRCRRRAGCGWSPAGSAPAHTPAACRRPGRSRSTSCGRSSPATEAADR